MRLNLELSAEMRPVEGRLDLSPLDEDTLDTTQGVEQVFYQEGLLNVNWKLIQPLCTFLQPGSARSWLKLLRI